MDPCRRLRLPIYFLAWLSCVPGIVAQEKPCQIDLPVGLHQVRVFGLQLGALKDSVVANRWTANDENLFGISLGSGGFAVLDPVDSFGGYVLTDSRLQTLQDMVWRLYGSISQFYIVTMQSHSPHSPWKLELARDLRSNTRARYPQQFDPCAELGR